MQTDGQLKTGRDVVIAALLGADEMGFATAPLIATGCVMMRACHLNTCPVGIATQDPELRAKFAGKPEHVVNFFFFVAEEARRIMAQLGIAPLRGSRRPRRPARGRRRDRAVAARAASTSPRSCTRPRSTGRGAATERAAAGARRRARLAADRARPALETAPAREFAIANRNRTVGGLLSNHVTKLHGAAGLPAGHVRFTLRGSAGQSFGAWLAPGIELTLVGEANDYVGKGLSGGMLALRPPEDAAFAAEENVVAGNTILYGATAGKAFFRGLVGERFAVRN